MSEQQDRSPEKWSMGRRLGAILFWSLIALPMLVIIGAPILVIGVSFYECERDTREWKAREQSSPPETRYEPVCWWDRGCKNPLHRVSGQLTPEFLEAVQQRLSPDAYYVAEGGIHFRKARPPGKDHDEFLWNLTNGTVTDILRKRWNLSEHEDMHERLKAEGILGAGVPTCDAVRKIAIEPPP